MAEILTLLQTTFAARTDTYAVGAPLPDRPNKFRYVKVEEELTPEVLQAHIAGEKCVGVYNIMADSTVNWFAMDFDGDTFEQAHTDAHNQERVLQGKGLFCYLERSRSGKGIHLWGFLARPVHASVVRRALKPLLTSPSTFDRLYPLQDELTSQRPLGNLIALPFYGAAVVAGNSSFLSPTDGAVVPPTEWEPRLNQPALIEMLAAEAPDAGGAATSPATDQIIRPGRPIIGALKVLSPYGCNFMRQAYLQRRTLSEPAWYAAIQQTTVFANGRDLAHLMSQDYPHYNRAEVDSKYRHSLDHSPVGCAYIHKHFPEMACQGCPMTAPYHKANVTLQELVVEADQPMISVGSFDVDVSEILATQAGGKPDGIPWPLPDLSEFVRLRTAELTVIGAMPSRGKTWLMVDAAVGLARTGVPVLVFSAETGTRSLRRRILANVAEVDSRKLMGELPLQPHELVRVKTASKELADLPLYVDYTTMAPENVLKRVEQVLLRNRIPLDSPYVIFFDYLQFGARLSTDKSEYDQVSRLSTEFKLVTKVLEHPVVVFSQVRRETEEDKEPSLTWFRSSGRIEQDLDVGIIITGERMAGERAPRTLTIVKQREGVANVALEFTLIQTYGRWLSSKATTSSGAMPTWGGPGVL